MNKGFIKIGVLAIAALIGIGALIGVSRNVLATGNHETPSCGSWETEVESDFENSLVKVDFQNNSTRITIEGKNGWTVTNWYLEVSENNTSGWDVSGTGNLNNYNPVGNVVEEVKVILYKDCPTPSPSPTVTPSPTPSESPTPTPEPCDQGQHLEEEVCVPDESPTPTPTPSEKPTPTPQGKIEVSQAGAPTCDGVPFVKLPGNALVKRDGAKAIVQWQPTQGSQAHVYYYQVQDPNNKHSVSDTDNDGYVEIGELGGLDWVFGVQQKDGCAASGIVWIIDDNAPRLFWLPAYDVVTGEWL